MKAVTPFRRRRNFRTFAAAFLSYLMLVGQVAPLALAAARPNSAAPPKVEAKVAAGGGETQRAAAAPAPVAFTAPNITATMTSAVTTDADADGKADPGDTITYTVNVTNNGTADATNVQFNDTVDVHTTPVSGSALVAASDSYTTIGDVKITVPANQGLLANDFNPDTGNNTGLTATAETKSSANCASCNNVTINADGSFTFDPKVGDTTADSFTYTVNSAGGSATATVKITITGKIWFVNNNAGACPGAPCDGRLSHPFTTLASFQAANDGGAGHPAAGDSIFVYESATNYVGPVTLLANQKFIGQDASASLATITGLTQPSGTDPLPAMNATPATIVNITSAANAINLGTGNLLRGFTVGATTGAKISGTSFGTLIAGNNTTPDVTLNGAGQALSLTTGAFDATSGFVSVATTSSTAQGINLSGITGAVNFGSTTVSGSTTQGILIGTTTADINFGNTSIGTASANSGGTDALSFQNNSNAGHVLTFGSLSISNNSNEGFVHAVGGGAVTVTGATTITHPGTTGMDIQGSNANLTFNGVGIDKSATAGTGVSISGTNTGKTFNFGSLSITTSNGTALLASSTGGTIVTSGGTISATGGSAIDASGIAFNNGSSLTSASASGGVVSGITLTNVTGSMSVGAGGTLTGNASAPTFAVSGGTVAFTYSGSITQAANAAAVSISGGHATGAITFQTGTVSATSGTGLQFDNADGTYNFNGTTTLNGGNAGVDILNGSSGTFSFSSNTGITSPSGTAFNVNASNPSVTYSGSITQNTSGQRVVNIDTTSSNTITFNTGTITGGASSTGVNINAANGNVSFANLNLGTSGARMTNQAVTITGGTGTYSLGTVSIFTSGAAAGIVATNADGTLNTTGTVDASGATAINISGPAGLTTLGMTLTKISSGGGVNGISIQNTSGSFTVNGDGTNNASGGLIQNSTGDGVLLANASNISLTSMSIQSSAHSGVKGSNNVQNFSFVNGTINNSGTASGTGDSNIAFNKGEFAPTVGNEKNLTGTLTVTGSTLTNAFFNGVDVYQFDGTVSNFNISNNTITSSTSTATSKGDGIKLVGFGSGSTVANYSKGTINANTISNFPSDAGIFFAGGNGTSAAAPAGTYGSDISTNAIKITNNTIAGQSAAAGIGTQGIFTSLNGTGTGFFNITSNSITNVLGIAIATGANGNTTYNGIILSNTINAHNINNSAGIGGGTTNTFGTSDTPTYNAKIGDGTVAGANNISNTFGNGILINSINGVGHTNVRILKNTVAVPIESPPSGTVYGIRVAEGNINSSGDSICLDISANTTAGNDDGAGTHAPGIGLRRQNGTAQVFGIVGMAATSSPGVENFVNGQNPGSASGSFGVGGTALISATTGFSNCSEPAVLALNTSQTNGGETLAQERDAFRNGASAVAFFAPTDDHNASAQTAQTSNASFDGLFSAAVSAASTVSAAAPVEAQTAAASGPAPREWSDIHAAPVERAAQQSDAVYSDDSGSSREGVRVVNASYEPSGDAAAQRSHTSRHVKARAAGVAAAAFATCAPSGFSGGHLCADLGTIKQGDSVQITFKVTLNNPPNLDAPDLSGGAHVSNQGTVSGTGFASVPTDDPSVGGATDPTKTPVDLFHSQTTLASDHPGSANNGDTVTFTATVSLAPATSPTPATPTTPSGTVTFKSDGNPISPACTNVPLSGGQAQCQTSALTPAGSPHSITAFYSGDGNFNPSDNTGSPLSQTIIACLTTATVNTTADPTGAGGTTSLRDAVTNLCTNGTINFDTAAGHAFDPATAPHTIQLASALPDIAKNMTITGPGAKVLSVVGSQVNGNSYRVFNVTNAATNVNISGLTITGGRDDTGGGDIQNAGTLNVSDSAVTFGNSATLGGGINNSGTLTVTRSAITNNTTAAGGGGISNTGTLTVKDSTISTNTANTGGNGGGVLNNSVANIVNFINDTITANSANGSGGGLFNASGTFQIVNTIVAGNTATVAGPDVSGTFTSQGHNLVGQSDGSTGFGATGDLVGSTATPLDPKLGALTNNGGPTQTHALLPNSPAIEAGDNTAATNAGLTTDQRGTGFPRIADSADADAIQTVDIGAFELHPSIEDITDKTTAEDTSLSFTFNLGDATGSGSPLITSVVGTSSNQTLVPDANISVTSAASDSMRTLNITPAANANSPADGTATITVTVTATNGQTATDTFVLTVTEVNDPPTAVNDTVPDILEDSGTYSIPISTLLANDLKGPANESGQTLSIIGVSNPTGGSVAINGSNVDFSPTLNFNGTAGFDYTITDNGTTNGNPDPKTSTAHVTFNITAVNDAPSFTKGADQTVAEDAGAQTVNNWATAISPGPADESSQIVNFIVTNDNNALFSAQPAVSSTGTLTYTPAANKFGQATVSVSLHDNGGTANGGQDTSAVQTFTITVTAVADTPSVTPATTLEDTQTTSGLVISRNAADSTEVTNFKITNILHGTLFQNDGSTQINSGDFITFAQGNAGLKFTPAPDFNGGASFDVQASTSNSDAGLGGSVVTASITVTAVNDAPSFTKGPDQSTPINSGAQTVSNWATSIQPGPATATDESGQTLNFIVTNDNNALFSAQPAVSSTGTLTYTPAANKFGQATVSVSLHDNGGTANGGQDTSAVQTFTITVGMPSLKVLDAKAAEPSTGTAEMLFTVVLSVPLASQTVSVNYATADDTGGAHPATGGTCGTAGVDYQTASGTLTFQPGETMKTIPVNVCADGAAGPDETLLLNLSTTPDATLARSQATGTITQSNPAGTFIISELRTSGPAGAGDQFVELYNNTDTELTVTASDASAGYGLFKMGATCADLPVLVATIPNGTKIPARGHYLLVGSTYSLGSYATGNQTLTADIEADRNVAVFSTADVTNLSTVTRLDAVGFGGNVNTAPVSSGGDAAPASSKKPMRTSVSTDAPLPSGGGVCDLFREGTNLPAASGSTLEYSFFRKECDFQGGCTTPGTPKDTNDNSADFFFADTQGTSTAMGTRLGAPGPENKTSPIRRDSTISLVLLDGGKAAAAVPNRDRDATPNTPNATVAPFGTLTIRRRVQNNTGADVTRLRFRIVEITTSPGGGGQADLRAITSTNSSVSNIHDSVTCVDRTAGTASNCTVTVQGTTLEQPPNQPIGGGYNSTLALGTVTPGSPLHAGSSMELQFVLGIVQPGSFRILVIVEALP